MKGIFSFSLPLLFTAFIFSGCATSGGTLFRDTVKTNTAAAVSQSKKADSSPTWTSTSSDSTVESGDGLTITTDPSGSSVYINGEFTGTTPLNVKPETGTYRITVKLQGYYKRTAWIDYTKGENREIDFTLKQITGFLYLQAHPSPVEVTGNGVSLHQGVNELPVGTYQIDARLFGYISSSTTVTIRDSRTTTLTIDLKQAPFSFSNLSLSRKVFNPGNPSGLGQSDITFTVSSYGRGTLTILSPLHTPVLVHSFRYFNKWNQHFIWKGTAQNGGQLADGTYTILLTGENEDGTLKDQRTALVTINRSLVIKGRNVFSGASGLLFAPSPDILPKGSSQIFLSSMGHADSAGYRFPSSVSLRAAPLQNMETDIAGGVIIQSPASNVYFLSLAAKTGIWHIPGALSFNLSALIKGTYLFGTYTDTMHNFTGLSVSLPAGCTFGPLTLIITPDIIVSPFQVSADKGTSPTGWNLWGYARGGLVFEAGALWTALSASMRTRPFKEGFAPDYPVSAGWEVNWILPNTGIILSGYLTGAFDPEKGYYLNAGGGVGVIN